MARVKLTLEQFRDRMGSRVPAELTKGVIAGMRAGLLLALKNSKNQQFLSGGGPVHPTKLTSRSGRLRDSIRIIEPIKTAGGFQGGLRAGGPGVPYAAIHEFGGQTSPHTILPRKAKMLSWVDASGRRRFAHRVRHPGSRIPARPYLLPGLQSAMPQIEKQIGVAIEVAFLEGLK